ncbi:hypothetical protein V5O48_015245 [Marasmius crinis-equi]|uniref:O-methyltransferase n=1 Tax=Marasmius crinis-equi TaxID=585013 RepID=A0ABR3EV30_9AGAR
MQSAAKPLALLAFVFPAVVASPVPGPGYRVYWDNKCGCHVTVTTATTTTATPTTTPCSTTPTTPPTTPPPTTTPPTTTLTTTTTPTITTTISTPHSIISTPTPTTPSSTTTPCTTTASTTSPRPSTSTPININTENHCGQWEMQNNYCLCNGGTAYCCQKSLWQDGYFNQNIGNCQTVITNNYGNPGSGLSSSTDSNSSDGSSRGCSCTLAIIPGVREQQVRPDELYYPIIRTHGSFAALSDFRSRVITVANNSHTNAFGSAIPPLSMRVVRGSWSPLQNQDPPRNSNTTTMPSPSPIEAPSQVLDLLAQLHRLSLEQEAALKKDSSSRFVSSDVGDAESQKKPPFDDLMRDKFIALDEDKCHFIYQLIRATGATNVVEAGTSFGVSTIYLALAVAKNKIAFGKVGTVIATEKEVEKAEKAREYWRRCGEGVEREIDLRVGDLRETLKEGVTEVDLVLLDIWAPMALPTLKILQPKLRPGAVILTDNTVTAAESYKELLEYLRAPGSGFSNMTLPYSGGFEMSVYHPH